MVSRLGHGYSMGGFLGAVLQTLVPLLIQCHPQQGTP